MSQIPKMRGAPYIALLLIAFIAVSIAASHSPTLSNETPQATPRHSGVGYPENFQTTLIRYAAIQRPDGTIRDLYISREAIDALRTGRGLPENTVIVIEGHYALEDSSGDFRIDSEGHYQDGEAFEMIHVLEKRLDWSNGDFVSEHRIGSWNFGSFDSKSGAPFDESITACFNCHNATPATDFLYSAPLLYHYARTGEIAYFLCDLPDRIAC